MPVTLDQMPVTEISGIGKRRAARLEPFGITTGLDLALADRRLVRKLLTVVGEAIWYELNGEAVIPLATTRPPHKVISRGGSIGKPTDDPHYLYGWLVRSVERLIEELEYYGVRTGLLEVLAIEPSPWRRNLAAQNIFYLWKQDREAARRVLERLAQHLSLSSRTPSRAE